MLSDEFTTCLRGSRMERFEDTDTYIATDDLMMTVNESAGASLNSRGAG